MSCHRRLIVILLFALTFAGWPASAQQPQPGKRLAEKDLLQLANAQDPAKDRAGGPAAMTNNPRMQEFINSAIFDAKKMKFFLDEGAALILSSSRSGDGGTIFLEKRRHSQRGQARFADGSDDGFVYGQGEPLGQGRARQLVPSGHRQHRRHRPLVLLDRKITVIFRRLKWQKLNF